MELTSEQHDIIHRIKEVNKQIDALPKPPSGTLVAAMERVASLTLLLKKSNLLTRDLLNTFGGVHETVLYHDKG